MPMNDCSKLSSNSIRSIAVRVAGLASSDYDDEFDAKSFAEGFAAKADKAFHDYVGAFAVMGAHCKGPDGDCKLPVPTLMVAPTGAPVLYKYSDGKYTAVFALSYGGGVDDKSAVMFSACVSVKCASDAGDDEFWSDCYSYTFHVTSISGEPVSLRRRRRSFCVDAIAGRPICDYLDGKLVIDEFGVGKAAQDADPAAIGKANFIFLKDSFEKTKEKLANTLLDWEKKNSVVSTMAKDVERVISDHDRTSKEAK